LWVSYEDIGGLDTELQKVREVVEFPMKYPELFKKLGIATSELKSLARMSEGFVGSDIESVCRRARFVAMQKYFFSGNRDAQVGEGPRIDMDDFKKALDEVKEQINAGNGVGA